MSALISGNIEAALIYRNFQFFHFFGVNDFSDE